MSSVDPRSPRVRRGFTFIALAAVLGLSAMGLTQCRLMDDSVTGVDLKNNSTFGNNNNGKVKCDKECETLFKACKKDEDTRNKAEKKRCDSLPKAQKSECKKAESTRHKNSTKVCSERKKACKKACEYREGNGNGGR
jgi:hypothetical protein